MALAVSGGSLQFIAEIENSDFGRAIRQMEDQLKGLTATANDQSAAMEGVASKAALAIGSYLSVTAASDFLNRIIEVRGEFQKLEAVLTNSLGSNALAKGALGMISDYAAKTPFQLTEVANAYVKLVNQGFKPTRDELNSLGDLAASTGKGFDQLSEAILDAQTNQFERLKEFGIKASKEGENVKFTFKGVETVVNDTSEAIKGYIVGLGNVQGVSGATAAISATLVGQISNLRDSFDQMLNALGQSSEGVISDTISGLNFLVTHYQDVIDIIKVLTISYGSYKAALIASTALQSGLTVKELLHYGALELVRKAQLLLNASMLANPYALAAAAIGAVISSLVIFGKEATQTKSKVDLLAEAQKHVADNLAETQAKFTPYLEALKNTNLTEQERLNIYEKIKSIDPDILKGIDAKTLSYEKLKSNVDLYLGSLRKQIDLEANKSALTESVKQERELERQIKVAEKQAIEIAKLRNTATGNLAGVGLTGANNNAVSDNLNRLKSDLKAQQDVSKELASSQLDIEKALTAGTNTTVATRKRTVSVIDAEITELKKQQSQQSATSGEYIKFQKQINALEEERKRIVGETKAQIKSQQAEENKINAILEKRKGILDDLAALHRDATQSGLAKEASEIDKINEKYDLTLKKVKEFNEKYKNNTKVAQISTIEINQLGGDRATEVNNALLKQDAEEYKKNLDTKKDAYIQFQEAIKQVGIDKAKEMFSSQKLDYDNYLEFLKNEQLKVVADVLLNGANVGNTAKLKAVSAEYVQAEKAQSAAAITQSIEDYKRVVEATKTYTDLKLAIEKKYQKDVQAIQKNFTGEDQAKRLRILKANRDADLTDLDNNLARQSELYQTLNTDVIRYTRAQLQERLKLLKQYLKDGYILEKDGSKTVITPQMKSDLQQGIKQAQDFLNSTNTVFGVTVQKLQDVAKYTALAGQSFHSLASAISPLNAGLGDTLETMGEIADVAASAAQSAASFASGDVAGGISGGIAAITGVIKIFSSASESRKKAQDELAAYQLRTIEGEIHINEFYRDRLRSQVELNKLKIDGINAESDLLKKQQTQSLADYKTIFQLIQNESKVVGEHTQGQGGFLGIGRKTVVVQDLQSLAGASYDDLEKLFVSGKLTDKAKALFEELQKLKQEGVDIDAALEENKAKAAELFTGTTSDSILDSIVQGFADGKRATADFADNFEDLMRKSILNSLKYQVLEKPLKDLFDQFASDAESGGSLDTSEIDNLKNTYNSILENANKKFEELQKVTGVNFNSATSGNNSLAGAIKGMTATQADLLAGQFGGLRLTAIETLKVADSSLRTLNKIENNTAAAVQVMTDYYRSWTQLGLKVIVQ